MAICSKCNKDVAEGIKFCADCGAPVGDAAAGTAANAGAAAAPAAAYVPDKADAEANKLMGILSYLLFFIPLITGDHKKSPFVRFHVNQGTVLFLTNLIWAVCSGVLGIVLGIIKLGFIAILFPLVNIALFVLVIMGILAVLKGEAKELPVIGKFTIIK